MTAKDSRLTAGPAKRLRVPDQTRRLRCRNFRSAVAPALLFVLACLWNGSAAADFRLCNNTSSRVGIALGYKDAEGWTTEGWWNVSSRSCETLLRGTLVARYYYIYALDYDRGGEWSGQAFMCSRDKEFTIRGADNCLARGFDRTGFFEVDTGDQRAWTVQLTDSNEQQPAQRVPGIPGTIGPGGAGNIPGIPNPPGGLTPGQGLPPTPAPGTKP
ncbi:DUF1036 domain-containing protein [Bradyrhizobium sp.]|uniref:DUF1036 domain-containing protein n=1 Tax=Bradyrhizobium sp. TaxID=376 RepID=UPI0039C86CE0